MRHCPKAIAAMIELQWLTGMRPGEVCIMRPCDIEIRNKDEWVYRPHTHKTEHHELDRRIPLGPKARAIVERFRSREISIYMFRPAEVVAERLAAKHAARKTPMNQGNKPGVRIKGTQKFAECYTDDTYRKAVHRAVTKANKGGANLPMWNPNQLRHSYATRVRERFGIEAASDGLGHTNVEMTTVYAERSMQRMMDVAKAIG
jgi:integrase